jgi:hypothetical protein
VPVNLDPEPSPRTRPLMASSDARATELTLSDPALRERAVTAFGYHPDWPAEGITFVDFFPLFREPELLEALVADLKRYLKRLSTPGGGR